MIRSFVVLSLISLAALNVSADPSALLGKWASGCQAVSATEFGNSVTEMKADGTAMSTNFYYGDATCSGPVIGTDASAMATYTATDSVLTLTITGNALVIMVTNYVISGDVMNLTPVSLTVNGEAQQTPAPVTVKRVQ